MKKPEIKKRRDGKIFVYTSDVDAHIQAAYTKEEWKELFDKILKKR